ncbi:semaphorin-6D isoform X1 [Lepisosteus oculatus]|uniref:Semaphorin 6D n=1 Tax=Lepisosteus oculatus TaxID=7918 RepID=W5N6U0_LEPOC|nr:PREDICTED: semaphorin-6D isoform X1 [Lepisosteus oculatus]XP_015198410.1 PREDICTED: semaphorin-6D isoform X1 [Lepisosteus oculatus]XP_015198411.1 PREDICTED: semaphorin-6D isoform X1 [Lepisosteus oculatus]XP_015198412.1 PREDICTED: semaphorin-6D isoform X1 [Lepisosteus oculatus]XP_015198413.1 PREDICTED: semaphorin-6D isoform X1 [Lepisosteus oculatus]XP_015198414.1 PREDICTED: semaphorin-6D isoform X1 [Lepisosteus oculatus]XP_015198415.1 PREDICTED: semaphorin-6D isoform X1 [Lepisosteus oculatu
MGQRIQFFLGLVLLATSRLLALSFPEDAEPLDTVDYQYSKQYAAFRGRPSGNESQHRLDFQLMIKIQDTLFIAGRDQVYSVSLRETYRNEIIPYRKLTWRSGQADRETCAMKGKHRDECHNFIKVLVPRNEDLVFICGTNGFNPMCRYYRLDTLEFDGEEISGLARCPFDAKQTNVALFADGKLYSATVADFLASDAVIYRSMGDGSALRTIKYDSKWLKEPHFLHAVDYGNYVYFFFREIAVEHNNLGKAVYSRVARICKNDVGGSQRVLEKHWTSFVKARLNCSVPGESFFYFDVLQSITDIIEINGIPTVIGVFTTQLNSIPGSAVCAFSMADIEKVFRGRFKEQKTPDSVWTAFPEDKLPKPRPGCCAGQGLAEAYKTSIDFPDETLSFIKSHPLMDSAVPSVGEEPWFTKTRVRYRLTAVAVDNSAGPRQNYTIVFIGSEAGVVLKVLAKTAPFSLNDSVLLEEIDVFNRAKCISNTEEDRKVVMLHLDKENHGLFVAFSSCVIRIPLSRCERHSTCQKACIASRDPYCGWMAHGSCENLQPGISSGYEQDVEYGNTVRLGDCHEVLATTSTPDYKTFGDPTSDMELSSPPVTTMASGPIESPQIIDSQKPELFGSRKFVLQDDPATSRSFDSLPGVPKGVWDVQSGESNQMVHMNVLITCVFAAFLLGAFIAAVVVYCYRDAFLRKSRKIHKDAESAQSCTDSSGSFAKLNGLFDSPVKEYQQNIDSPKLYTNLLSNGKDSAPSGDTKTMILSSQCQPPELAALPTPESTPVLQQKTLQPIKNQWEKAHNKINASRKDSPLKSPQYFPASPPPHSPMGHSHIPSAVVLPNATHDYRASFSNTDVLRSERKMQNIDQPASGKPSKKDHRRSVDARNTLNDLLKHLNETNSGSKAILGDIPMTRQNLMLDPMANMTEVPPKVPSREASLYSPSSTLPRNSPTKRVDVPTTPVTSAVQMSTLERQRGYHRNSSQRHSISALPKNINSPNGIVLSRQPSMNRGGYVPPTPPSRMDSHGAPVGHPQPSISRQSSYSGQGSLPRTGIKRTPSIKPDVPPKPNGFVPQTTQVRAVNKYSY